MVEPIGLILSGNSRVLSRFRPNRAPSADEFPARRGENISSHQRFLWRVGSGENSIGLKHSLVLNVLIATDL
jgi:hypothetical protein